jgi:hypothetical protein
MVVQCVEVVEVVGKLVPAVHRAVVESALVGVGTYI